LDPVQFGYRTQELTPMSERPYPKFFQVLIRQIAQYGESDVIFGKPPRILPETECFEPVRDLLGH
jgi:hypothetical protein